MFIDRVGLRVRNIESVLRFYVEVIGLTVVERTEAVARLGVGGDVLVELASDPSARLPSPGMTGLYHVAFEMGARSDLARWIASVANKGIPVTGMADHRVTESVYIEDPEGNAVEVYVSRPEAAWRWQGGQVEMGVFDLDIPSLLRSADPTAPPYGTAPADLRIGHIHLKVGDLPRAERFYAELIGFRVTRRAPGVVFMSSGRYHHHIAANTWETEEDAPRGEGASGLAWFSIAVEDRPSLDAQGRRLRQAGVSRDAGEGSLETEDPWGNVIRLTPL